MPNKTIGETLKKARKIAGNSVKEVSEMLRDQGFKASPNTIYSWENNNSQPTPDALILLCKFYGIKDVLATFGYTNNAQDEIVSQSASEEFTEDEKIMIYAYRLASDRDKGLVNDLLAAYKEELADELPSVKSSIG